MNDFIKGRGLTLLVLLLLSFATTGAQEPSASDGKKDEPQKTNRRPVEPPREPEPWDGASVEYMAAQCVTLATGVGNILLEMYPESAPETVRNFLNLVSTGALNTTTFSRVAPGFVIQGGDLYTSENLTNELRWRRIRKIPDEPSLLKHERGIISMARPDEPNSATTDFFILTRSASPLDGKFAAFGRVVAGMDVVMKINRMPVEGEKPKMPVRIALATVSRCSKPTTP